jgi:hypothetical protein
MPRVHKLKTKARRGDKPNHRCQKCREDILPGQERFEWEFRYGGPLRQHVTCGYPSRSALTQSKMGGIYDAIDSMQWGDTDGSIAEDLRSIAETVRDVANEYEEAASNFGNGGENQERYEQLESFADDLDSVASEIEGQEPDEGQDEDEFIEALREQAQAACDECPY